MEEVIVNAIHVLTVTWVFSWAWAGAYAWRPLLLDAACTAVALFSWIVIISISVTENQFAMMAESPLFSLGALLAGAGVYVGLTYFWVKVREYLGDEPPEMHEELISVTAAHDPFNGDDRV